MKIVAKIIAATLVLIIFLSVIIAFYSIKLNKPPENMPEISYFKVETGNTAGHIANELKNKNLIRNSNYFKFYVKIKKTASKLKAGLYKIDSNLSMIEIHNILIKGAEETFKVSIPPGLSSKDIAHILESKNILIATDFLKIVDEKDAEGLLFPDTYNFPANYPPEKVIEVMLNNFCNNLKEVYPEYPDMNEKELHDRIVMASIVEKEYRLADEAPIIASIFYNRLEKNMSLSSCATVVYVITEELGKKHPERLFYRDLELVSDYNTYLNKGLPPGPICNPGKIAVNAAFNPAKTDYLYFLLEDIESGKHVFSNTFAEHNRSYNLYIKKK